MPPSIPLVSVIVPVYNVEPYLRQCLDSIINQTYTSLEIILVDDGATDDCGSICDAYAARDARIRVFHQQNQGLSDARNAGMDAATADYLMFVDADDWIDPAMAEKMLAIAVERGSDVVECGWREIDETMGQYRDFRNPFFREHPEGFCPNARTLPQYYFTALRANKLESVCVKLIRRGLLEDAALRFHDIAAVGYEDALFSYCLYCVLRRADAVAEPLYFYRIRPDSITTAAPKLKLRQAALESTRLFEAFAQRNGAAHALRRVLPMMAFLRAYVEYRAGCYHGDADFCTQTENAVAALHRDPAMRRYLLKAAFGPGLGRLCAGESALTYLKARILALAYVFGGPRFFLRLQLRLPRENS